MHCAQWQLVKNQTLQLIRLHLKRIWLLDAMIAAELCARCAQAAEMLCTLQLGASSAH
jgi:hypothetical protein